MIFGQFNKSIIMNKLVRNNSQHLDDIIGQPFNVLDHGFIRVVDYMGNDSSIVEAAQLSYGEGTKKKSSEVSLINYLMGHQHTSPFEMCELKLHVKLPIFVMRQWVRHRTASLNEYSARYSILSNEFYIPELQDIQKQSKTNKQGREEAFTEASASKVQSTLSSHSSTSYGLYEMLIDENVDLARELARMSLPVNFYTEMYWKINLHNLFHFLKLRTDAHAQKEIRVYANVISDIVSNWVPLASNAFNNYVLNSITFSGIESKLIGAAMTYPKELDPEMKPVWANELSNREWIAFVNKIIRII